MRRGEKLRHALEERDGLSLIRSTAFIESFLQQRVLRKGRTEKKSISFSTVPTTGEFVINTRFFCVAFSDADEFVCERKIPQNVFSAVFLSNGGKENFGRIKIGHI